MVISADIEVILPTYNGAKYLTDQVQSIFNQTLKPIRLLIRDDGSSDGTQELLSHLKHTYGCWISLLPSSHKRVGCCQNINILLSNTSASYVALSDQDDIWLPFKIEQSYYSMKSLEENTSASLPLLVHSDPILVDKDLNPLGATLSIRQKLNLAKNESSEICLTNVVTGCTCFLNRPLINRSLPIPKAAVIHDWWLAIVASAFGKIHLDKYPSLLYRQHSHNLIGCSSVDFYYFLHKIFDYFISYGKDSRFKAMCLQVTYFHNIYGMNITPLVELMAQSRFKRLVLLITNRRAQLMRKHGPLRTIFLYVLLLVEPSLTL